MTVGSEIAPKSRSGPFDSAHDIAVTDEVHARACLAQLGDEVVYAEKGDLVFKPRDQWHTFWNAGDGPLRILEIISPGGFEHVFKEMAEDPETMTGEAALALDARYGIEADYDSMERLCEEHGLNFPVEG